MADWNATPHYTVVFNLFIFMQIFNLLVCRKIDEGWNFFAGLEHNMVFVVVFFLIFGIQILLGN